MSIPSNGSEIQALLTTVGRRTGVPHTVRVRIYYLGGRAIATSPYPRERRDWVENVIADSRVRIKNGDRTVSATAKVISTEDREIEREAAKFRIGWRGPFCPALLPDEDTFVEFLGETPLEPLFGAGLLSHGTSENPLAADTIEGILAWQESGNRYANQARSIPESKDQERMRVNEEEARLRAKASMPV